LVQRYLKASGHRAGPPGGRRIYEGPIGGDPSAEALYATHYYCIE